MGRKSKVTPEMIDKAFFLYRETSCNIATIARHLDISESTAGKIIDRKYDHIHIPAPGEQKVRFTELDYKRGILK